jgi:hypothetical protein
MIGGDVDEPDGDVVTSALCRGEESAGCFRLCPKSKVLCLSAEAGVTMEGLRVVFGGMVSKAGSSIARQAVAWLLLWVPGSNVQGEPPGWGFQHVCASAKTIPSAAFRALRRL